MAGAYRRRSSTIHPICRLPHRSDRWERTAPEADQEAKPINALAFGQGLRATAAGLTSPYPSYLFPTCGGHISHCAVKRLAWIILPCQKLGPIAGTAW